MNLPLLKELFNETSGGDLKVVNFIGSKPTFTFLALVSYVLRYVSYVLGPGAFISGPNVAK